MTYRIATGRDAGRKVVTLQTLPGDAGPLEGDAGKVGGSRCMPAWPRKHTKATSSKSCAATSRARRSASSGYRSRHRAGCVTSSRRRGAMAPRMSNGMRWTSSLLAALVPPPRAHLTRFHGVFAPNANLRAQPGSRGAAGAAAGDAAPVDVSAHDEPRSPESSRDELGATAQAGLFHRHTTCAHCGGAVRIVASIEDPKAIRAILAHFEKHGALEQAHYRPAAPRRPPRDEAPATQPAAARVRSDAATTPQGCARPCAGIR